MGILCHVQIDGLNACEFKLGICQIGADDDFGVGTDFVVEFGHGIPAPECEAQRVQIFLGMLLHLVEFVCARHITRRLKVYTIGLTHFDLTD